MMMTNSEMAATIALEFEAAGVSARVDVVDGAVGGQVVSIYRVVAALRDARVGCTEVRVIDGPVAVAEVVAQMRSRLAVRAAATRSAIRRERSRS